MGQRRIDEGAEFRFALILLAALAGVVAWVLWT
jgi:hypothetical protein